jgi:hypothetical protein
MNSGLWVLEKTYYGDFTAKLILDLAFFTGIWGLLLYDLVEVFNTHLGV